MYVLDLFAGGGGGVYGGRLLGWKSIGYVEWDRYCQQIILARIRDGVFEDAPVWSDARTFTSRNNAARRFIRSIRGKVGITAGFPCQPFSCAGQRQGEHDPRNMWPATARIIGDVRPRFALLENVPGLLTSGYFGRVIGDLHALGMDAVWDVFSAASECAPHLRERLWLLAYPNSGRREQCNARKRRIPIADARGHATTRERQHHSADVVSYGRGFSNTVRVCGETGREPVRRQARSNAYRSGAGSALVPDARGAGLEGHGNVLRDGAQGRQEPDGHAGASRGEWWATEPRVGRVAHGVADRVNQLKALGNGQVPDVVVRAWRELTAKMERLNDLPA